MDKVMAQLESLLAHYEELQEMMSDPEAVSYTHLTLPTNREV